MLIALVSYNQLHRNTFSPVYLRGTLAARIMRQHGDNGDNVVLKLGENHFHNISAFTWPSWPNVIDIQPTATGPVLTEPSNYENYKNDSGAGCWLGSTFYKLIRLAALEVRAGRG